MKTHKLALAAGAFAAITLAGVAAQAADDSSVGFQSGDILVRARGLGVLPSVSSKVSTIGGHVDATNSAVPELDATYFFTSHISAELIAAMTRHHLRDKGSSAGDVDLGRVSLLPPTLTLQYHFDPIGQVIPYVGAGINYTFFFDHELPAGSAATTIHYDNTVAAALQAGADFHIQGNWYANIDVKHIFLNTSAKINGGAIKADVALDPTIVGVGIGYRF